MTGTRGSDRDLSQARQRLLERLLRKQNVSAPSGADRIERGEGAEAPLSFAQQQLWFLEQMDPGSSLYNIASAVRLDGALDVAAFARALRCVARGHEVFRTSFVSRGGEPVQVIGGATDVTPVVVDVSTFTGESAERLVTRLAAAEAARPFDLGAPPLMRLRLFRLGPLSHVLTLVVHHIVADGWSLGIITGQLSTAYAAELASPGSASPAHPSVRYADVAAWQRARHGEGGLDREIAAWRDRLDGAPTFLDLPTDRPRPAVQTYRGAHRSDQWNSGERTAVRSLCREAGTSEFMTLLAALGVVLSRYADARDLLIGAPIAGRMRPEVQDVVGFFVNTVPLRVQVDESLTFRDLLTRVRDTTLEAFDHQDVPFDRLVDAIAPARDLSHSPLVQTLFELRSPTPSNGGLWPGLQLSGYGAEPLGDTAKFDLAVTVAAAGAGYEISVEYAINLFDAATIDQLLRHFRCLLTSALRRPESSLAELALVDAQESHQLLNALNPSDAPPPDAPALLTAFTDLAGSRPDAIAVVHGERQLTYAAVRGAALRVATRLKSCGIGPESRVGICLAKSPELVIAVLATHLAGGAYVPMDPAYPAQRLGFMLTDSRIAVLITDPDTREALGTEIDAAEVSVHEIGRVAGGTGAIPLAATTADTAVPSSDALAYVIYTSGSTGTPRGVQITQRNLAAALASWKREYELTPADRHLQMASPAFDVFTGDLTRALGSGGTLVLCDRDLLMDPAALGQQLDVQAITCAEFVPVVLRHVAAELARTGRCLPGLRVLIAGSDAWNADDHARAARMAGPRTRVLNSYGLTEATVDSTFFEGEPDGRPDAPAPIGRPMWHARAYVLDRVGSPSPLGVPGELYIGGPGVGRGYLGQPGRTAASFVPDPFSLAPGSRRYRTGDRARWSRSGELEFLGRLDNQVKLRGFRIELGEVEGALAAHEDVRAALAVVRPDPGGTDRLVAYVVPHAPVDIEELVIGLRVDVGRRLPEYMVPSAVTVLEVFPLTPNGKLDRKALPAPVFAAAAAEGGAPETESERTIAGVWAEVLGRDSVGADDNFFALGGDSIISLQVVARSRAAGWVITPKQVFEFQTVRGLAAVAERADGEVPTARQGMVSGCLPLTAVQSEFLHTAIPAPHHYNMSMLLTARRAVDRAALGRAVTMVLRHHDALRLRFEPARDGRWQVYQCGVESIPSSPLAIVDTSGLDDIGRAAVIESVSARAQASLDLGSGCLVRAVYFDCSVDAPGRLMLAVHHLVVDGVSWRVLLDDLAACYDAAVAGTRVQLPAKTTAWLDWAARVREVADSDAVTDEIGYWLGVARSRTPVPHDFDIPASRLAAVNTLETDCSVHFRLPADSTMALLHEVPSLYRTRIDDALLSALAQAMAPLTGGRRLVVDSERHGRSGVDDSMDLSRTVGWFTSTYPVLLDLGLDDDPGAMLGRIKEQLRAVPREGVGWGLLRHVTDPALVPAALRDAPKADVAFNYLGQFDAMFGGNAPWQPAAEDAGSGHDLGEPREYPIEVTAIVSGGCLEFLWSYSSALHRPATIEAAAERLANAVRSLVAHCRTAGAGGRTPSDFPLANLDQGSLDRVLAAGDVADVYALSPMQQGMLFHDWAEPGSGAYLEQFVCRISADLDVAAFRSAWDDVFRHHSGLRVSVHWRGLAAPVQAVHETVDPEWAELDFQGENPERNEARWAELLRADRERGVDFERPPLLRFTLARLSEHEYRFLFTHHHLLIDGWAFRQLLGEVLTAYAARRVGHPPNLPEARPYRDYIEWLARRADGEEPFWRGRLAQLPALTPISRTEPNGRFETRTEILTVADTAALADFAKSNRLTLNTLVQAAWSLTVGRTTGQTEITHGMTLAGRPADLPGVENIVGLFINTVPVHLRLPEASTVSEWLHGVQDELLELRQYESTPLVRIAEFAGTGTARKLFDTLVVFENYPLDAATADDHGAGLHVSEVRTLARTNFTVSLVVAPADELPLELIYDTGAVDQVAAGELLSGVRRTMLSFVAAPQLHLGDVEILTGAERQRLVEAGRGSAPDGPARAVIHDCFANVVASSPDAVAVTSSSGACLTYAALDAKSGRLAARLAASGVRPRDHVVVVTERGPGQVIATLAALRAGAAYVPLDPRNPVARNRAILDSVRPAAVIADPAHLTLGQGLAGGAAVLDLDLDHDHDHGDGGPGCAPAVTVYPDDLAYVIFTSGSTGVPKGVAVTHANVVALALDSSFAGHLSVLVHSSAAFDASTYELWSPLLRGGRLVMAPPGELTVADLARVIRVHGATTAWLTAGLFRIIADQAPEVLAPLREVWTGGEAVPADAVVRVIGACPDLAIVDGYGPTETTTFATRHEVTSADLTAGAVPIGRPLDGMQTSVLDDGLRRVPVDVIGHLFVSGEGLARGYLDDPALTAARFVPDPHGPPGARMYRTGDLAAWAYGSGSALHLMFAGRRDQQVKIRGFRIELAEVEAAIQGAPDVRDAVVLSEAATEGARLVAFAVVDSADRAACEQGVRRHCAAVLPDYMIPGRIEFRDDMPLTANGKVDRAALMKVTPRQSCEASDDRPQTPGQAIVLSLVEQAAGRTGLGVHDDFFLSGGNSLAALALVGRLREVFGRDVPLATLYRSSTPATLAAELVAPARDDWPTTLVPLRSAGDAAPLFCVHPKNGTVFCYGQLARMIGGERPIMGVQSVAVAAHQIAQASIRDMARTYLDDLLCIQPEGPYYLCGYSLGGMIAHDMACLLRARGAEVRSLILLDCAPRLTGLAFPDVESLDAMDDADFLVSEFDEHVAIDAERLRELVPAARLEHIANLLDSQGVRTQHMDPETMARYVEIARAHTRAAITFEPSVYDGSALLLRCDGPADPASDPADGWSDYVRGRLDVAYVSGTHTTMLDEPHVAEVVEHLRIALTRGGPGQVNR